MDLVGSVLLAHLEACQTRVLHQVFDQFAARKTMMYVVHHLCFQFTANIYYASTNDLSVTFLEVAF